jgi:hypothetical protein
MIRFNPLPGIYRHYKKGDLYRVLGNVIHTETSEVMVFYERVNMPRERFVQPLQMFMEVVPCPCDQSRFIPRFKLITLQTSSDEQESSSSSWLAVVAFASLSIFLFVIWPD